MFFCDLWYVLMICIIFNKFFFMFIEDMKEGGIYCSLYFLIGCVDDVIVFLFGCVFLKLCIIKLNMRNL